MLLFNLYICVTNNVLLRRWRSEASSLLQSTAAFLILIDSLWSTYPTLKLCQFLSFPWPLDSRWRRYGTKTCCRGTFGLRNNRVWRILSRWKFLIVSEFILSANYFRQYNWRLSLIYFINCYCSQNFFFFFFHMLIGYFLWKKREHYLCLTNILCIWYDSYFKIIGLNHCWWKNTSQTKNYEDQVKWEISFFIRNATP